VRVEERRWRRRLLLLLLLREAAGLVGRLVGRLPVLLLLGVFEVGARGGAVGRLWGVVLGRVLGLGLVLLLLLLGAEQAKGPVGEVEAAEDDDCSEDLERLAT
jgi:hypothetical protein